MTDQQPAFWSSPEPCRADRCTADGRAKPDIYPYTSPMFNGKVFLVGLAGVAMLGAACGPKSVALKRERELLRGGGVAAGAQAGTNPGEQAGSQAVSGPENGAGPAPAAGGLTPGS